MPSSEPSCGFPITITPPWKQSSTLPNPVDVENPAKAPTTDSEKNDMDESISQDPDIIDWDGPDDMGNPMNWPKSKKIINTGVVSAYTFVSPLASSMFAPGVSQLMKEFHSTSTLIASLVVSIYLLGYAFGPLLFAPLSEVYGRRNLYYLSIALFILFSIACAKAPSMGALITLRFFCGFAGSVPVTNGAGTVNDMFPPEKRGAAISFYALGPLLGPVVGPIAGGFLAHAKGWRWVFWLLAIVAGALAILMVFILEETFAPVLLRRRVDQLKKQTNNPNLRSALDVGTTPQNLLTNAIIRPCKMLVKSPICVILGIYIAIVYGYLYLLFTSISVVFETYYSFSTSTVGLVYLGLGIGTMIGVAWFSIHSDRSSKARAEKNDAIAVSKGRSKEGIKPEYRLPPMRIGAVVLPIGFFIYGWTASHHDKVHWIVPILAQAMIGLGIIMVFLCVNTYLIESFERHAASAVASNVVVRSIAGVLLPLAGLPMYESKLGIGWGNSLLGFIAMVMIPVPWLFSRYGEMLRTKYPVIL